MKKGKVTVELSSAEALVLFEFLSRFSDDEILTIEHQAEEQVLWEVHESLESFLAEPFAPNYDELLAKARAEVCEPLLDLESTP